MQHEKSNRLWLLFLKSYSLSSELQATNKGIISNSNNSFFHNFVIIFSVNDISTKTEANLQIINYKQKYQSLKLYKYLPYMQWKNQI